MNSRRINQRISFLKICFRCAVKAYSQPEWLNAYQIAKSNSLPITICDRIYVMLGESIFARIFVAAFGIYSAAKASPDKINQTEAIYLQFHKNEIDAFERLRKICLPDVKLKQICWADYPLFRKALLLFRSSLSFFRIISILGKHKNLPFFVACQFSAMIASWSLYIKIFSRNTPKFVAVSTSSMPAAVSIIMAARASGIPSVFCAHGMFAEINAQQAPCAELLFLQNEITADAVKAVRKDNYKQILWGHFSKSQRIKLPSKDTRDLRIGIFPSTPANLNCITDLINSIKISYPESKVFLRLHPLSIMSPKKEEILAACHGAVLNESGLASELLSECDVAVVGNSSVLPMAMHQGVPAIYDSKIDVGPHDLLGFLTNAIAIERTGSFTDCIAKLEYYNSETWRSNFRKYDPFLELDDDLQLANCRIEFFKWLDRRK